MPLGAAGGRAGGHRRNQRPQRAPRQRSPPAGVRRRAGSGSRCRAARGRLQADDIGLVINTADPYSVEVGEYYMQRRRLKAQQVLRVELPLRERLSVEEFEALRRQIQAHFGLQAQALALAWAATLRGGLQLDHRRAGAGLRRRIVPQQLRAVPALALCQFGLGAALGRTRHAPVDAAGGARRRSGAPHDRPRRRRRRSLGWRGSPPANAYFLRTDDPARNVRVPAVPACRPVASAGRDGACRAGRAPSTPRGACCWSRPAVARLAAAAGVAWLDGGLGDHLTSYGGQLSGPSGAVDRARLDRLRRDRQPRHGQRALQPPAEVSASAMAAAALPARQHRHRGLLEERGWPQQSLFVGEPLAAPFARR